MAKMKFYLNIEDAKLRTLDDLRENFFADSVLAHYHTGKLAQWLDAWGYVDELEKVQAIHVTDAKGILVELCRIFGVDIELDDIEAGVSTADFLETQKNEDAQNFYDKGEAYYHGNGVSLDYRKALECYHEAASQGHAEAQFILGTIYAGSDVGQLEGINTDVFGIEPDNKQAVKWYQKAAEQGNAKAQNRLGYMYDAGRGVDQDNGQALKWYRKAAEQGNAKAQCNLGIMYQYGKEVNQDYAKAIEWYCKAARGGSAGASINLGLIYENGLGVEQDYVQAAEWYRKAAEQGNAYAQFLLGKMYENGNGVEKDITHALDWYRKAAELGNANAQNCLGVCYHIGDGVEQDYTQAVNWYRKAAELGNADAQVNLGVMYQNGLGVEQDNTQAAEWYRKAAEQGNAYGQDNLGIMYDNGLGVEQDIQRALSLFQKAAKQGHANAQKNLGIMYENGRGVKLDSKQAVEWYRKAAQQGSQDAMRALERMSVFDSTHPSVILSNHGNQNRVSIEWTDLNGLQIDPSSVVKAASDGSKWVLCTKSPCFYIVDEKHNIQPLSIPRQMLEDLHDSPTFLVKYENTTWLVGSSHNLWLSRDLTSWDTIPSPCYGKNLSDIEFHDGQWFLWATTYEKSTFRVPGMLWDSDKPFYYNRLHIYCAKNLIEHWELLQNTVTNGGIEPVNSDNSDGGHYLTFVNGTPVAVFGCSSSYQNVSGVAPNAYVAFLSPIQGWLRMFEIPKYWHRRDFPLCNIWTWNGFHILAAEDNGIFVSPAGVKGAKWEQVFEDEFNDQPLINTLDMFLLDDILVLAGKKYVYFSNDAKEYHKMLLGEGEWNILASNGKDSFISTYKMDNGEALLRIGKLTFLDV